MRKILLGGVAVAALLAASSAMAADLGTPAYKAPPAPAVLAPNWTGFYVGANVGAGWGTKELYENGLNFSDPFSGKAISNIGVNGFLGGGQIGYNYQIGWVVLGIEGSFDWAGIKGDGPAEGLTFTSKTDWIATVTGRIGGTIDHALLYLIGGVAWAHDKYTLVDAPFPESASGSETRVGGLLGGGIEYAFTPNWSGKLEYNFMDFGSTTPTFCSSNTPDFFETSCAPLGVKQQIHTVTVGLNYKFDWR